MEREFRKLKSNRGVIFLETAFILPIFMLLLCFIVDIPRIISTKQRLVNASRLISEIKSHNNGNCNLNGNDLKPYFFDAKSAKNITLNISNTTEPSLFGTIGDYLDGNDGAFSEIIGFLGNVLTGGGLDPYIVNVFNKDKFYGTEVTATMPTLLPTTFYTSIMDASPETTIKPVQRTYSPDCNSAKYTGKTFLEDFLSAL